MSELKKARAIAIARTVPVPAWLCWGVTAIFGAVALALPGAEALGPLIVGVVAAAFGGICHFMENRPERRDDLPPMA